MAGILDKLRKSEEVELSVKGRVSGKPIPRPVWFALSDDESYIYLVPVSGRKTQWYLNVKKEPRVTIEVGGSPFTADVRELPAEWVGEVLDAFRAKYGEADIKKYYPMVGKDDVAFEVRLPSAK